MLTSAELAAAQELARRVAKEFAKPTVPNDHIGEAEVMILAQRQEFADGVLLIDELAARRVALTLNLRVSGFAGILLVAVEKGLLTADAVQERLLHCQQQGTYYGAEFIQRVYEQAKEGKR
jgi:predicted nucleic acid-binding protein